MDATGASIPCCMWSPSRWAVSYMGANSLVLLWTLLLFAELRVFVVSGTIAQWYFQPGGADNTKVPPTLPPEARKWKGPATGTQRASTACGRLHD